MKKQYEEKVKKTKQKEINEKYKERKKESKKERMKGRKQEREYVIKKWKKILGKKSVFKISRKKEVKNDKLSDKVILNKKVKERKKEENNRKEKRKIVKKSCYGLRKKSRISSERKER